jgi:hypothetical protein
LAEVLGRNQGPTELDYCFIDNFVLANRLRGKSRLKSLNLRFSREGCNLELLVIAGALEENKGLVDLNPVHNLTMSIKSWGAICDSLETHPTLQVLRLRSLRSTRADVSPQMQALLDMMKVNKSIHTIHSRHELFHLSVIPYYLETNRLGPRVRAIQNTRGIAHRAKVLGRALLATRTNPNRFWMLLSGNLEVAFLSTTTTIVAAAKLPTPVSAAITIG